jgi:hypothetical protein
MPVIYQPGIWDQLGAALTAGSGQWQNQQRYQDAQAAATNEETQRQAQMLMQLVQSGGMDAETANQNPALQKLGINLQPSVAELRRKLANNPGTKMNVPWAAAGVPGVTGTMPNQNAPAVPAGTPDQRAIAGLPSVGQISQDNLQSQLAQLKAQYVSNGGTGMTDAQLRSIGQPTASEVQVADRSKLDPVMGAAADRYVDTVLSGMNIDPTSDAGIAKLQRQSASIAKAAYDRYVADNQGTGAQAKQSPSDMKYAQSFFSAAVAQRLDQARTNMMHYNEVLAARSDKADGPVAFFNAIKSAGSEIDTQINKLQSTYPGNIISTLTPQQIQTNPAYKSVWLRINNLQQQSNAYKKAATDVMINHVDMAQVQKQLGAELKQLTNTSAAGSDISAGGPPSNLPPAGKLMNIDVQGAAKRILAGKAQPDDLKALLDNHNITQDQYNQVMSAVNAFRAAAKSASLRGG